MRSEQDIAQAINRYADTVKRLCFVYLKNRSDTEDVLQTVFLKYALHDDDFENETHKKAWIIRVTINACKDASKSFFRKRTVSLDEAFDIPSSSTQEQRETLDTVLALPEKYRTVIYLHYYEGYSAPEISKLIGKNTNTIYTLLNRAKNQLRKQLGGESYEAK